MMKMLERPDAVVGEQKPEYLQKDFVYTCSVCGNSTTPGRAFEVGGSVLCQGCVEKLDKQVRGLELEKPEGLNYEPYDELDFRKRDETLDGTFFCVHCLRPVSAREINVENGLCISCEFPDEVDVPSYFKNSHVLFRKKFSQAGVGRLDKSI